MSIPLYRPNVIESYRESIGYRPAFLSHRWLSQAHTMDITATAVQQVGQANLGESVLHRPSRHQVNRQGGNSLQ